MASTACHTLSVMAERQRWSAILSPLETSTQEPGSTNIGRVTLDAPVGWQANPHRISTQRQGHAWSMALAGDSRGSDLASAAATLGDGKKWREVEEASVDPPPSKIPLAALNRTTPTTCHMASLVKHSKGSRRARVHVSRAAGGTLWSFGEAMRQLGRSSANLCAAR
mmetsp:Transcript_29643/g.83607  ORF Transcript_29643/g.83607 Transcript_29643/m.83607 type:complete len:167 (+) Transcript_29643:431-931(+)